MPDGIFNQGLKHHRSYPDLICIQGTSNSKVKTKICKTQLFHFKIAFQVFNILPQRNKCFHRILQIETDQLGKTTQESGGIFCVLEKNHFFNAVQRIENEMWIHLRMQCFHFIFSHQLIKIHFFTDLADTIPV